MTTYAVAAAPGYFGAQTPIISIHHRWGEAVRARGIGQTVRWAIYEVADGTIVGDTIYSDMHQRIDRRSEDLPSTEIVQRDRKWVVLGWKPHNEWKAHQRNRYFLRQHGDVIAGPFDNAGQAEFAECAWHRDWLKGMASWSTTVPPKPRR